MMPTTYRADVNHKHFDWNKGLAEIDSGLRLHRDEILRTIGFYDEYGVPTQWSDSRKEDIETEGDLVIDTITGILAKAAAIAVGAGCKPVNKVLATLRAISKDPKLVTKHREHVEPEALGVVALHYDRGDGVGRHPFDILDDPVGIPQGRVALSPGSVKAAADRGIAALAPTAKRARPNRPDLDVLADGLGGVFRQYSGVRVTRIVELRKSDTEAPLEDGRFKRFLELVIPPLEAVLEQYPDISHHPDISHRISIDSLVKRSIALQLVGAREIGPRPNSSPI